MLATLALLLGAALAGLLLLFVVDDEDALPVFALLLALSRPVLINQLLEFVVQAEDSDDDELDEVGSSIIMWVLLPVLLPPLLPLFDGLCKDVSVAPYPFVM